MERPAQAARTHNPTPIHLSCGSLKSGRLLVELRAEAASKKDPLIGGPKLRIVEVAGAGLNADASTRKVGACLFLKPKVQGATNRAHTVYTPQTLKNPDPKP